MGVGVTFPGVRPPAPPFDRNAVTLDAARYAEQWGRPTLEQQWLLRRHAEAERNKARRLDWETRFKVLGPREQDTP